MGKKKKEKIVKLVYLVLAILVFSTLGYNIKVNIGENGIKVSEIGTDKLQLNDAFKTNDEVKNLDDNLKIHFVDVGQGDSIIIEQNNHYMLIDAGTNSCEKNLLSYIKKLNITKFDYIIATHAHEDHIGSMDAVINNYDADKILFSKHTSTTKTFENFVSAVKNKGLKLYAPNANEEFLFQDSKFIVLAPNSSSYEEINDYSIVIKFIYKDTSYLFTGDAESLSEKEILEKGLNVKADVLKVGHHGSESSTSQEFLNEVNPTYAVISCGKDNDYGHPKSTIMNRLKNKNIVVYRTDEQGSIVLTSDGENISFDKEAASYKGY